MKFTHALAAAAALVALSAAPAHATTWGVHDLNESSGAVAIYGPGVSFSNDYSFSLVSSGSLLATTSEFNFFGLDINGGTVTLFKDLTGSPDVAVGAYTFDGSSPSLHTFSALGTGDYYYRVTGTTGAGMGGGYTLNSTLAPVPEPESLALMLAGLGALGVVGRRRRQA